MADLDRREDGTIGIVLPGKVTRNGTGEVTATAADLLVELHRPTLEELLDLWQGIDERDQMVRDMDSGNARAMTLMRSTADWFRSALVKLGPPGVYKEAKPLTAKQKEADPAQYVQRYVLVREDLTEPPWFGNGTAAAVMLGHWQNVPLDLGVSPESQ